LALSLFEKFISVIYPTIFADDVIALSLVSILSSSQNASVFAVAE